MMLILSARNTSDLPKWDAFPLVATPLIKSLDGTLTFADLHEQMVDNRMLFPRLVYLAVARLTDWSTPAETAATVVFGGLSVLMLAGLARRTWPQGGWKPWVMAVTAGTVWFSFSGSMIWTYGPFLGHSIVACMVVAQVWVFSLPLRPLKQLVLSGVFAFVATYCYIYGWLCWGLLGWQILGLRVNQTIRHREFWLAIGVLVAVLALNGWWYFTGYTFAGKSGVAGRMMTEPGRYVNFFLQWLGSGFGNPWPSLAKPVRMSWQYPLAWWAGLGVLVLAIISLLLICKNRSTRPTSWLWFGMVWWGMVSGVFVTIGRADFASEAAFWPRYQLMVYALYLGLGVVLWLNIPKFRSPFKWLGLLPLGAAMTGWVNGSITGHRDMRADFFRSQTIHGALIMKDVAPDPILLNQLFPDNLKEVNEAVAALVPKGFIRPGIVQSEMVTDAKIESSPRFKGQLTEGETLTDGSVSLNGWAVDKDRSSPVDAVVISVQSDGGEEIWWTVATKSKPANKQALKLKLSTANSRIGWDLGANETIQNLSRKPLPTGKLTFRAYALDVKTLVFHLLEGEYRRE